MVGVQKQEKRCAVVDVAVGDEERALGASGMEVCGSILGGGDAAPVLAASARPRCSTRARHQSSPRHPSHRATAPPPHGFINSPPLRRYRAILVTPPAPSHSVTLALQPGIDLFDAELEPAGTQQAVDIDGALDERPFRRP